MEDGAGDPLDAFGVDWCVGAIPKKEGATGATEDWDPEGPESPDGPGCPVTARMGRGVARSPGVGGLRRRTGPEVGVASEGRQYPSRGGTRPTRLLSWHKRQKSRAPITTRVWCSNASLIRSDSRRRTRSFSRASSFLRVVSAICKSKKKCVS